MLIIWKFVILGHCTFTPTCIPIKKLKMPREALPVFSILGRTNLHIPLSFSLLSKRFWTKNEQLDEEDSRFLQSIYRSFMQRGAMIGESSQRDRLFAIQGQIDDLKVIFNKNLMAGHKNWGLWFTPEELEGIPPKSLGDPKQGSGENSGKLFVERFGSVMRSGQNSAARKRACLDYYYRFEDNAPIFRDIILLRDEAARLLGFSSHADRRFGESMADSPETVVKFLDAVKTKVHPITEEYLTQVRGLKKAELEARGDPSDDHFFMWDEFYYRTKLKELANPLSTDEVSEYFPLEVVVMNMIDLFNTFFGIDIRELESHDRNALSSSGNGSDLIWHETVRMFAVRDTNKNQDFLGYLYLDLFEREGKRNLAACSNILPVRICMSHIWKYHANYHVVRYCLGTSRNRRTSLPCYRFMLELQQSKAWRAKTTLSSYAYNVTA